MRQLPLRVLLARRLLLQGAISAGTVRLPVKELRRLDREHESYWAPDRILRIEGRL